MNALLTVDLGSGHIRNEQLPADIVESYIGGRGLGAYLLWSRTAPGMPPLDGQNPLMFLVGPLSGIAPGGAQVCLVYKSPATGVTLGHSLTGGNWGPELRAAGYLGLLIAGKSEQPKYLFIDNDKVELRDASHLWGKGTFETEALIKSELRDPTVRVLSIGPAGEKLVKFASVQQECFRSAARGGPGAVMGSKMLKAVAVRGSGDLSVSDPGPYAGAFAVALEKLANSGKSTRRGYSLVRWGSTISTVPHSDISELDVKNYREGWWEDVDKTGGLEYERQCRVKARSCFSCPISCMQLGVIRDGRFAGMTVNPDFDSTGTIGPGCLVTDMKGLAYLSRLGDDLGVDDASMGNVTGFAMECYEKGLLTRADLGGIDLRWGNVDGMIELWHMVVSRTGIGNLLAEGVKVAAQEIGQGAEKFAMHVKGLEMAGYAAQAHPDRALQYAVGDRGGCHHYGLTIKEQDDRAWADALVVCSWHAAFIDPPLYLNLLNAATGSCLQLPDWGLTANRMLTLSRCYNLREGMRPLSDDVLPDRLHDDALTKGPKAGAVYDRERFRVDRAAWYRERGYDEKGLPTPELLQRLGLGFVAEVVEGIRAET